MSGQLIPAELKTELLNSIPFVWQEKAWAQFHEQRKASSLAHAYLIYGDEGLAKTLFAEAISNSLLCLSNETKAACGECAICKLAKGGTLPDLLHVAPMEGSRDIKIDQIRMVSDFMSKSSHSGRGKVVIVSAAHCLNIAASNALLKTLEEPTEESYLFLVSQLPGALSATIRSRCQRLKISSPSQSQGSDWLAKYASKYTSSDEGSTQFPTRPLLIFDASRNTDPKLKVQFISALGNILTDQNALRSSVAQAVKLGELMTIGYLDEVSTILIKYILTNDDEDTDYSSLLELKGLFSNSGIGPASLSRSLLQYQHELQVARRQFLGSSNPNPQLVIESLLWKWSQLLR